MKKVERKALAVVLQVLVKRLGIGSAEKFTGSVTLESITKKVEKTHYTVTELSWSLIDMYDQTDGVEIYSTKMEDGYVVFNTKERSYANIQVMKISDTYITGKGYNDDFKASFETYDKIEITDDEQKRAFTYIVK